MGIKDILYPYRHTVQRADGGICGIAGPRLVKGVVAVKTGPGTNRAVMRINAGKTIGNQRLRRDFPGSKPPRSITCGQRIQTIRRLPGQITHTVSASWRYFGFV